MNESREGGCWHLKCCLPMLREIFPEGKANDLNFVLFSTSGVHGTYTRIEEVERTAKLPDGHDDKSESVTVLVVHPRIVCLKYGLAYPKTTADFAFLKKLRRTSHRVAACIGGKP
jgi:hypothetical protein